MRLLINGFEVPSPDGKYTFVVDVDPAGEEIGPVHVRFLGGTLTIKGDATQIPGVLMRGEATPFLILSAHEHGRTPFVALTPDPHENE